jgi:hypothetical protein
MDDDDIKLEDAQWEKLCRGHQSRSFPQGAPELRKQTMLRQIATLNAELERMVAEHLSDPSKPDPRKWVL